MHYHLLFEKQFRQMAANYPQRSSKRLQRGLSAQRGVVFGSKILESWKDRKEIVVRVVGLCLQKRREGEKFCSNICRKVAAKRTRRWRKTFAKRGVCMVMRNSRHYLVVNHVKRGLKSGGAIIQPIINAFLLVPLFALPREEKFVCMCVCIGLRILFRMIIGKKIVNFLFGYRFHFL